MREIIIHIIIKMANQIMLNYYEKNKSLCMVNTYFNEEFLKELDDLSLISIYTQLLLNDGEYPIEIFFENEEKNESLDSSEYR